MSSKLYSRSISQKSNKKAYIWEDHNHHILIMNNDEIKGKISLSSKNNEIKIIVSTNSIDALLLIILAWKQYGAVIPDQKSVSGSAAALITRYYNKNKDNPDLIKSMPYAKDDPFKSIYFPNESLFSMVNNIEVIHVTNEDKISELHERGESLFSDKYWAEKQINVLDPGQLKMDDSKKSNSQKRLEILAKDEDTDIRINVASNPNTCASILDFLARDHNLLIKEYVAIHNNTSIETLDYLSKEQEMGTSIIRKFVAKNPKTSVQTLEYLSHDPNDFVKATVASNPNTSTETLDLLAQSDNDRIKDCATDNPNYFSTTN